MPFKLPVVLSDLYAKITRRQEQPAPTLEVVASLMLSAREKVWVVEVGGSWLVLGSGANGLTTLGHLHKGGAPLTLRPGDLPFDLEQLLQTKTEKRAQLHDEPAQASNKTSLIDAATTVETTPMAAATTASESAEAAAPVDVAQAAPAPTAVQQDAATVQAGPDPLETLEMAPDTFPAIADVAAKAQHQIGGATVSSAMPFSPSDAPKVETAEQLAEKFIGIRAEAERIDAVQTVGADEHGFPDPALAVEVTVSEISKKPVEVEPAPAAKPNDGPTGKTSRSMLPVKAYSTPTWQKSKQPEDVLSTQENLAAKEDPVSSADTKPSFMALYAEVKNGGN